MFSSSVFAILSGMQIGLQIHWTVILSDQLFIYSPVCPLRLFSSLLVFVFVFVFFLLFEIFVQHIHIYCRQLPFCKLGISLFYFLKIFQNET